MVLSVAAVQHIHLHQEDPIYAFLNGDLSGELFMELALGYEQDDPAECVS